MLRSMTMDSSTRDRKGKSAPRYIPKDRPKAKVVSVPGLLKIDKRFKDWKFFIIKDEKDQYDLIEARTGASFSGKAKSKTAAIRQAKFSIQKSGFEGVQKLAAEFMEKTGIKISLNPELTGD